MDISKSSQHRSMDSCKVVPGRCNCIASRRNRNNIVLPSSLLCFVLLAAISMQLATGLAEPFEITTQTAELASSDTEVVNQDERIRADMIHFGNVDDELDDSYVSLSGGGLEQEIRDAIRSEVESEIEAGASDHLKTRQEGHSASLEQIIFKNSNDNGVVREPKTLETDAGVSDKLIGEAETETEKESESEIAEDSETAESRHRPLPNVTSDLVSVIFNEDRAITEQPITKTNLLALEQQHKDFELKDTTPAPVYDPPKHQVTKKQGVEDLLPIEVPNVPEIESEIDRQNRQMEPPAEISFENVAVSPLPDIKDNIIETKTSPRTDIEDSSPSDLLVGQDTDKTEIEATSPAEEEEVRGHVGTSSEPDEAPIDANEETSPAEEEEMGEYVGTSSKPDLESIDVNEETSPAEDEEVGEHLGTSSKPDEEPSDANEETSPAEEEVGEYVSTSSKPDVESNDVNEETSPAEDEKVWEHVGTSSEPVGEPIDANEEAANAIDVIENTTIEQIHSVETTVKSVVEEVARPKDEKIDRSEDSTATPLVSYPPHDAGQTFDSNLADESTAHLSLASTNRSTLIIALCSGTAVIFIIISLVIFVVSFQRQHGTLDIEMQEQRHGKDTLDEEDAQMKLLDVDLSTPVILVSMGTEETDECL